MTQKDKIQIIITAILVLVLIIVLKGKPARPEKTSSEPQASPLTVSDIQQALNTHVQEPLDLDTELAKLSRDPFVRSQRPVEAKKQGPQLNGIMWGENKPLAVVNKQIVEEGMVVDGYTVVKIMERKVILNDGQQDTELYLRY